jgi:hypothetical protein
LRGNPQGIRHRDPNPPRPYVQPEDAPGPPRWLALFKAHPAIISAGATRGPVPTSAQQALTHLDTIIYKQAGSHYRFPEAARTRTHPCF